MKNPTHTKYKTLCSIYTHTCGLVRGFDTQWALQGLRLDHQDAMQAAAGK